MLASLALAAVLVTVATVVVLQAPKEPVPTEFGFTISSSSDPGGSWAAFTEDVDTSVEYGQSWVRLGIASWLVAPAGDRSSIGWDQRVLAVYDREIAYVRSKGLRLFLVTSGAPDWTRGWSSADYARASRQYWSFLAQRFADRAEVWQVFNEADTGHFRTFERLDRLPAGYTAELGRLLHAAADILHGVNPAIVVTTNSTGYPLDDRREEAWSAYFSALGGALDAVTLDLYPTDDPAAIAALPGRVVRAQERSGLPVIVGEVGLQTCDDCYSEGVQGSDVAAAVAALRSARPRMVLVYEMRDSGPDASDGESTFGIVAHDGRRKAGHDRILAQMQPEARP